MKTEKPKPAAKSAGKVFDVQRPGKAPASPTSKPVIIGHRAKAQSDQTVVSGIGEERPYLNAKRKIEIRPGGSAAAAPPPEPSEPKGISVEVAPVMPPAPAEPKVAIEPTPKPAAPPPPVKSALPPDPQPEPSSEPAPDPSPAASGPQGVAPSLSQPETPPAAAEPQPKASEAPPALSSIPEAPSEAKTAEDEAIHDFQMQPIIVSHHSAGGSAVKVFGLVLLVLVLAVVAINILMDAEVLKAPSGIPHTDFF
jgi:hypothetical protein